MPVRDPYLLLIEFLCRALIGCYVWSVLRVEKYNLSEQIEEIMRTDRAILMVRINKHYNLSTEYK
jgi:hypothetical protein